MLQCPFCTCFCQNATFQWHFKTQLSVSVRATMDRHIKSVDFDCTHYGHAYCSSVCINDAVDIGVHEIRAHPLVGWDPQYYMH